MLHYLESNLCQVRLLAYLLFVFLFSWNYRCSSSVNPPKWIEKNLNAHLERAPKCKMILLIGTPFYTISYIRIWIFRKRKSAKIGGRIREETAHTVGEREPKCNMRLGTNIHTLANLYSEIILDYDITQMHISIYPSDCLKYAGLY